MVARWLKRLLSIILIVVVILILILTYLIDCKKIINMPFVTSVLASFFIGILTIIGGFLLAYHLIERDRLYKERERIARAKSALNDIRNTLRPWLYEYAHELSRQYKPSEKLTKNIAQGYVSDSEFKGDVPLLEDIFGIRVYGANGNPIRGTGSDFKEIDKSGVNPQSLLGSCMSVHGRGIAKKIEHRIRRSPIFFDYVSEDTAVVESLRDLLDERMAELDQWVKVHSVEGVHIIDNSIGQNTAIRHNLRSFGHKLLDILIAIDADIANLG